MRAIAWLAGGLVVVALGGAGDSAQSLTLIEDVSAPTAVEAFADATAPQQPPVVPAVPRSR